MIITCSDNMGYIYLIPPAYMVKKNIASNIQEYFPELDPVIAYKKDDTTGLLLEKICLSNITYDQALRTSEIIEEYCNDKNKDGYLIGIELSLYQNVFVEQIKNGVFKICNTIWRGQKYNVLTFDFAEKVYSSSNTIYPLTDEYDTFVIVNSNNKKGIGFIKALITSRDDIYPVQYLLSPQFVISKI